MRKISLLSGFLAISISCFSLGFVEPAVADNRLVAEHKSFLRLLYPNGSNGRLGYQQQQSTDEVGGPGNFKLKQFFLNTDLPMPINRNTFFRLGLDYNMRIYDFEELAGISTSSSKKTLHKCVVKLGLGRFLSDDFLAIGSLDLGMYSDLENVIDTDDYQLNGEVLGIYRINPGAELVGGVRWSEDFETLSMIPIMGLRLLSTSGRLHVSATLPIELSLTYGITPATDVYIGAWLKGERYRIRMGEDKQEFDLQLQERRIGAGVTHWIGKHVSLGLEGGLMLESQFEFKLKNAGQFGDDVDSSLYGQVFLAFAI